MIYLDYNATPPVDRRVAEAMWRFVTEHFGNPSSTHALDRAGCRFLAQHLPGQYCRHVHAPRQHPRRPAGVFVQTLKGIGYDRENLESIVPNARWRAS